MLASGKSQPETTLTPIHRIQSLEVNFTGNAQDSNHKIITVLSYIFAAKTSKYHSSRTYNNIIFEYIYIYLYSYFYMHP